MQLCFERERGGEAGRKGEREGGRKGEREGGEGGRKEKLREGEGRKYHIDVIRECTCDYTCRSHM